MSTHVAHRPATYFGRQFLFSILPALAALWLLPALTSCGDDGGDNLAHQQGHDTASAPKGVDTVGLPAFSGRNAYDLTAKQVAFGPRNPNSAGAKKALAFLVEELKKYADDVRTQEFTHNGYNGEKLNLTNVIASFNVNAPVRILLCAHWDTRPRADWDPDSSRQKEPILAANDAGSGVAVLLELARVLKQNPQQIGVDILLVDGEDYGDSRIDDVDQYFLGARYFSQNLPVGYKPAFGVLLDMVGDVEADFAREKSSLQYAPSVVDLLWKGAADLGLQHFSQREGHAIQDDHKMLNEIAGIPTVDIIDAELVGHDKDNPRRRYWHTHKDTMENIGSEPLEEVGRLLIYTIYKLVPTQVNRQATASK